MGQIDCERKSPTDFTDNTDLACGFGGNVMKGLPQIPQIPQITQIYEPSALVGHIDCERSLPQISQITQI